MFQKVNVNNMPIEKTSHSAGSRKILATKDEVSSPCFEAYTYGFLPTQTKWDLHSHEKITEICIVVKGNGTIIDGHGDKELFIPGDRFIFKPDEKHEIENLSQETAEFYFFRIRNSI